VKKGKIKAITAFKIIQGHRGRYQSKASICGGVYAPVYCILQCVYDVVVKKVHVRYLICW